MSKVVHLNSTMSKKRPGVEAAIRLTRSREGRLWNRVEAQFKDILSSVEELETCNDDYEKLRRQLFGGEGEDALKDYLTKEELKTVIRWKFSVGKKRHALMKHLNSNSEKTVEEFSRRAIALARDIKFHEDKENDDKDIKAAIEELTNLRGVGPASSSAILSMVRPDLFCYMYDEIIDCFLPKRTYTLKVYLEVNEQCRKIADSIEGWTTSRVARALWVAARACAWGKEDYTLGLDREEEEFEKSSKRRRKS